MATQMQHTLEQKSQDTGLENDARTFFLNCELRMEIKISSPQIQEAKGCKQPPIEAHVNAVAGIYLRLDGS